MKLIKGNIVDIKNRKIFPGIIKVKDGYIDSIEEIDEILENYIIPGFVDSHIHIESSMLTPQEFGRIAVSHGTVGVLCDPHEIANVCGLEGVLYMIKNSKRSPLKFSFAAPSCVPATPFDHNGAILDLKDLEELLKMDEVKALAEFMNYPGVVNENAEAIAKIAIAKKYNKPVDGHAPNLKGEDLRKYIDAGISTDHECTVLSEATEKISLGMKIQIREGSACKDFQALHSLIKNSPSRCMFASDDLHPDDLLEGHINRAVKRAKKLGYDLFDILRISSMNPIEHYKLDIGLLQQDDLADFLIVDNLEDFGVIQTWINGEKVYDIDIEMPKFIQPEIINNFAENQIKSDQLELVDSGRKIYVIAAQDKVVTTEKIIEKPKVHEGKIVSDIERDLLKIVVVNRYEEMDPGVGFIKGFNLKHGAIASSVSHDSHNIVAVGVDDKSLTKVINAIMQEKGGIAIYDGEEISILPLPIAGIISNLSVYETSELYKKLDNRAKELGSNFKAPFMTMSFMSLLVIPELKINEKGLFATSTFSYIPLWE